jgi:hypothetical protein
MTPADLYAEAAKRGLRLESAGDNLAVFPKGVCPADFIEVLRQHKAELLEWLRRPPCPGWQSLPPDDLPLDPVLPRPAVEEQALVVSYLQRQTRDQPGPLTAWLVRRECEYYNGPGRTWDDTLICYAAARDAACWQQGMGEAGVLERFKGFEEVANTFVKPPCSGRP